MKVKINRLIERSFRILQHLSLHGSARFGELSERLAPIPPSTLTRLLKALLELGYISQRANAYVPGKNFLTGRSGFSVNEVGPALADLSLATGLSAGLFERLGASSMKILARSESSEGPQMGPVGREMSLMPTHGFAKIFLAWSDEALQGDLYQRLRTEFISNKNPSIEIYRRELAAVRETGRVLENEERQAHVLRFVLAIPRVEPVLALGVLGTPGDFSRREEIFSALEICADLIEKKFHAQGVAL